MDEITWEDLQHYQGLKAEIKSIEYEIREIYVQSPGPREVVGGASSVPSSGDPTARKAMRIIERRERLEARLRELEEMTDRIEMFIDTMEDHHKAAIMRWHFIQGKSWRETCSEVYGYPNPDTCRMEISRYFKAKERKRK